MVPGPLMDLPRTPLAEIDCTDPDAPVADVLAGDRPTVLRGLVRHWPAVQAGLASPQALSAYLAGFYNGRPVVAFVGAPEMKGRFFYAADMAGFNFEKQSGPLTGVLDFLARSSGDPGAKAVYVGATAVDEFLPGFSAENDLPALAGKGSVPRIWVGNRTTVSTHYDLSPNLACVVAGTRRFILFPPEQVANLYVGPLDHTMAGQPASMVSVHEPDFDRYPRFREALGQAGMAELAPGDAIFVPPLWWHHVDALGGFNILLNHWWSDAPADAASPFEAMVHAILAIGSLPEAQRDGWRAMFENFVFHRSGHPGEHLPEAHRGVVGPSTPELRGRIRQFLVRALTRS